MCTNWTPWKGGISYNNRTPSFAWHVEYSPLSLVGGNIVIIIRYIYFYWIQELVVEV